ncbi:MAG: T9SS type A sorting domain-containing protein [Candidatus Coatesbacteria bacterium]|nr:T9SS type A sorting domain-containing protein [Candidatus Coatesbacteria bacterium]
MSRSITLLRTLAFLSFAALATLASTAAADVPLPGTPDWEWHDTQQWAYGGLAFGDADDDGFLDLLVGTYDGSNWYPPIPEYHNLMFLNADFGLPSAPDWAASVQRHCSEVAGGDVDGDGVPDAFFANGGSGYNPCTVYYGDSAGPGSSPDWTSSEPAWAVGAALGDIDGDGYPDAATANQGRNQYDPYRPVYIFWGTSSGLQSSPGWQSSVAECSQMPALGDLDGSHLTSDTAVFTADGVRQVFWLPHAPFVSIDDVRLDGSPFTLNWCCDPVAGWFSPDGHIAAGQSLEIDYSYSTRLDLVVAKWINYDTCVYPNDNGTPQTTPGWSSGRTGSGDEKAILVDYDRDDDLDLLVAADSLRIYENTGGTLGAAPVWETADDLHTNDALCGDFNHDGYPEIVVANGTWKGLNIYENQGGSYNAVPDWTYTGDEQVRAIAVGDVDCNGALDLVAGFSREPLALFLNTTESSETTVVDFTAETGHAGVLLRWSLDDPGAAREVVISRDGAPLHESPLEPAAEGAYLDSEPAANNSYLLTVTAADGRRISQGPLEVLWEPAGGITELAAPWPNPAAGVVNVSVTLGESQSVALAVYDLAGRRVASLAEGGLVAGRHDFAWSCVAAPSGVYLIRLETADGSLTRRVVVER